MSREEAISMMAFQTGILTGIHSKGDDIEPACEEAVDLVLKAYFDTDEPLYRRESNIMVANTRGKFVQVWPKETDDG